MSLKRQFAKLRAPLGRRKAADDLVKEMRAHLRMEEQGNLEVGMSSEELTMRRCGDSAT
jgi:hypothetical protein